MKLGDKGFLSRDITVLRPADEPQRRPPRLSRRNHLKKQGLSAGPLQPDRQLRARPERDQHSDRRQGTRGLLRGVARAGVRRTKRYGGIDDEKELRANLAMNCIPAAMLDGEPLDFDEFLDERRRLMALKIKAWFDGL